MGQAPSPRADRDPQRHLARPRGGLRCHQVGDVGACNQQHQRHQHAQSRQRAAIVFLHIGYAGGRRLQKQFLVQESIDHPFGPSRESLRPLLLPGLKRRAQALADRLGGHARPEPHKRTEPTRVRARDSGMHHRGNEDVDRDAGLRAREMRRRHAHDFKEVVVHPECAADRLGVLSKAARPIIVGKHRVGMRARRQIVVFGKQPPLRGLQPERVEHPAGDILPPGFLHFLVRTVSQIRAVRI